MALADQSVQAMLFILVLEILRVVLSTDISWEQEIFVDSINGTDAESCLNEGMLSPCASFNMALKGLRYSSSVIYVSPGTYTLENGNETSIKFMDMVAIIGITRGAVIKCSPLAGLMFHSVGNIVIENITFHGCGRKEIGGGGEAYITPHFLNTASYFFQAALIISYNFENVLVNNANIIFSNGSGLLFYEIFGNLTVKNCVISDNSSPFTSDSGELPIISGGVIIFNNDFHGNIHQIIRSNINNNVFSVIKPHSDFGCPINYGGGITLVYIETNVKLLIDSCNVSNNTRGLSLVSYYSVGSFAIELKNTNFNSNLANNLIKFHFTEYFVLRFSDVSISQNLTIMSEHFKGHTTMVNPELYQVVNQHLEIFVTSTNKAGSDFPLILEEITHPNTATAELCSCLNLEFCEEYNGLCPTSYFFCYDQLFCDCSIGRTGRLCGQCWDGFSVAINSHNLECVPCSEPGKLAKGWTALIGLEFIPVTVMIGVIAILNVNLNQGSLNTYIFFCQILTISFPSVGYPAWLVTNFDALHQLFDILVIPLSIWNLNLMNFPSYSNHNDGDTNVFSICISSFTTPLGALSFWYVIAFYPMILQALIHICIIFYDNGYRCVTCFMRPVHRILARFWRMFDIQPSLTTTVASVYTLCFTQLAAISLKILHPTRYHSKHHSKETLTVFFYDGTQQYFKGWHAVAGSFAILVLLFLIVSSLYLSVYPFQWFQKCFNKLKFKKDFLVSVTDVFTGPYKDGTQQNSRDYRYFAGLHFFLRLVIMLFYYIPQYKSLLFVIPILEVTVCVLVIITILIFRPYKRNIHSFNEVLLFLVLGVLSCYFFYSNASPNLNDLKDFYDFWYELFVLPLIGVIVLFIVTPYCVYWIIRKGQAKCRYMKSFKPLHAIILDSDDDVMLPADTIRNDK